VKGGKGEIKWYRGRGGTGSTKKVWENLRLGEKIQETGITGRFSTSANESVKMSCFLWEKRRYVSRP